MKDTSSAGHCGIWDGSGAVCAARKQDEPLALRDASSRQGAGTRVEAIADIQTGRRLGREVKNTLSILVLSITPGCFVEKHDIFFKRLGLCP